MVFEKICDIIRGQFSLDEEKELTLDTDLVKDLSADSLDMVEIVMALEDEFNISIPEEDVDETNIHTIGAIVEYIEGVI